MKNFLLVEALPQTAILTRNGDVARGSLKIFSPVLRVPYGTLGIGSRKAIVGSAISLPTVVVAVPDQVSCRLENETVMLDLNRGVYFGLNRVGSMIWEMIQRPQSVQTIYFAVLENYEVDPETCKSDLIRLLEDLQEAGLADIVT